jgi:membrane protease YdiL (CAAX protease family)
MNRALVWVIGGVAIAIAVTSTMDAAGVSAFSALPLAALLALFWYLGRFSAAEIGFFGGASLKPYLLAVLYPLSVIGAIVAIAAATHVAGRVDVPHHHSPWLNLLLITGATIPVALITEEGFFRGWLWAALRRVRCGDFAIVMITAVIFALWHWSSVVLPTGFNPPISQVPVFMLNATLLGTIWGLLRLISGSLIVTSVSHGVWNGLAYTLFGFGSHVGALGIADTALYGPEVGVLGLFFNAVFAAALWLGVKRKRNPRNIEIN